MISKEEGNPPDWIPDLTGENFLAVYDVALDIRQQLQLTPDVVIPLLQPVVKFQALMPGEGSNMRDRYCELRWNATEFLKRQGVIADFRLLKGNHRWEGRLRIQVEENTFGPIASMLDQEYEQRSRPMVPKDSSSAIASPQSKVAPIDEVRRLVYRFHSVAVQLRNRHEGRSTLDVTDEYDVQDLLHALLNVYFEDVRPEEWTPSYAGKSARADFLLKPEQIVVECKKTRQGLGAKEIGDQLILDIERYSKLPDCKILVCMVYNPENRIVNPGALQADLSRQREGLMVEVIVIPKLY